MTAAPAVYEAQALDALAAVEARPPDAYLWFGRRVGLLAGAPGEVDRAGDTARVPHDERVLHRAPRPDFFYFRIYVRRGRMDLERISS